MGDEGEETTGLAQDEWLALDGLDLTEGDLANAETMTIGQTLDLLEAMAVATGTSNNWLNSFSLITTAISAIYRRGTLSGDHRQKIIAGVKEATSAGAVYLPMHTMERFFRMYATHVNANNADAIMNHYRNLLPENVIASRNVVIQAAGSGLTTYMTIIRAMSIYAHFRWEVINNFAPQEFAALRIAMDAIGGNIYFGFNSQMGAASAKKFPVLAYCAFQLCISAGGDRPLTRYQGMPKVVPNKPALDQIIDAYIDARAANIDAAEGAVGGRPAIQEVLVGSNAAYRVATVGEDEQRAEGMLPRLNRESGPEIAGE